MKVNIIAQYHPAAALHQPRLWAVLLDDWQNMPEKVEASYIVTTDTKVGDEFALDTESNPDGRIGAWSIAYRNPQGQLCVTPFQGKQDIGLGTARGLCLMHHAKWDIRVLENNKMAVPPNIADTMIAAYCMGLGRQDVKDTGRSGDQMVGGLGLKYLARRHLGMEMKSWDEVKDHPEQTEEYNAKDSVGTLLLWEKWKPKLPEHFWKIDMPLLRVLMAMEDRGVMVDPDFLQEYAKTLDEKLANIDLEVNGEKLNPFSPKQVAEYVYGTLGYEPTKFTETKQPSVDKEVLETIDDPIVRKILEYREFYKERKTYVSAYVNKMDLDNRVHCDFKQTSTATGRLSCARPNLQNVTKGTDLRRLFIAPPDMSLVVVDWKQLELLTFAAITGAQSMLKAIAEGRDIHQETADRLGLSRDDAKTINFLMLYGGTPFKISQEFHIPIDKARALQADYFKAFPEIGQYIQRQIELAHSEKKVTNFFGRTRRLDGMFSEHWKTIKDTEREAVNTPVQGTAAEIVKLAMIDLHYKHHAPMILQVHDEIMFEVPIKEAKEYAHWLKDYLPTLTEVNGIRFPVDVGIGQNWKEAKEKK